MTNEKQNLGHDRIAVAAIRIRNATNLLHDAAGSLEIASPGFPAGSDARKAVDDLANAAINAFHTANNASKMVPAKLRLCGIEDPSTALTTSKPAPPPPVPPADPPSAIAAGGGGQAGSSAVSTTEPQMAIAAGPDGATFYPYEDPHAVGYLGCYAVAGSAVGYVTLDNRYEPVPKLPPPPMPPTNAAAADTPPSSAGASVAPESASASPAESGASG